MSTTVRKARSGVAGLAVVMALAAGAVSAQQLVIDGETGEQIQINGLSGSAMQTLRSGGEVTANTPGGRIVLRGEVYRPGIWTDPDGCQHWVMDDGIEGYMAPILTRSGMPVCNGGRAGVEQQFVIRKYDVPMHGKGAGYGKGSGYGASHGYVEDW